MLATLAGLAVPSLARPAASADVEVGAAFALSGPAAVYGTSQKNAVQLAADPIANQAKTPVLGVSNTASGVTDIGPYIFRNSITEADVLPVAIETVKAKRGVKRVAVMYGADGGAEPLMETPSRRRCSPSMASRSRTATSRRYGASRSRCTTARS